MHASDNVRFAHERTASLRGAFENHLYPCLKGPSPKYDGGQMKNSANARFAITSRDEKPYSEGPSMPKLSRASPRATPAISKGRGRSNT